MKDLKAPDVSKAVGHWSNKGKPVRVVGLSFSSDGQFVASIAKNNEVKLWHTSTEECRLSVRYTCRLGPVVFSPRENILAIGFHDGAVKLWEPGQGELVHELERGGGEEGGDAVTALNFSLDDTTLACGFASGMVKLWKGGETIEARTLEGHSGRVTKIVFLPGYNNIMASASKDKTIKLWETSNGDPLRTIGGYSGSPGGVAFSPDRRWLAYARAAGGKKKTIELLTLADGEVNEILGPSELGSIVDIAFLPSGNTLAAIHGGMAICLWDVSEKSLLRTLALQQKVKTLSINAEDDRSQIRTDQGIVGAPYLQSDGGSCSSLSPPFVDEEGIHLKSNAAPKEDVTDSPYMDYRPPRKPPTKVHFESIIDQSYRKNRKADDDDGHYIVQENTDLTERYKIVKLLGEGHFGKVVEAWDLVEESPVAIKINRSWPLYRDASMIELRVLSTLALNDRYNRNKCIHLRHCFDFRNHICIVTDLYSQNLFDFLKNNEFTPFPGTHVQTFARQLLTSVAFLHDLNIIHADLKPENILLVDDKCQTFTCNRRTPSSSKKSKRALRSRRVLLNPEIRLIDFGSATFEDEHHSSVVGTEEFRAPEVILDLGWSFPCDIWSIGCVLVELYTGNALFQIKDDLEHLALMEAVVGSPIDRDIIEQVRAKETNQAAQYFTKQDRLDYPNAKTSRESKKYVKNMKALGQIIPQTPNNSFNSQFVDLLRNMFVYDPKKRITALQALQHPWFKEKLQSDALTDGPGEPNAG